ncbi:MAG: sulfatase-like hydrolase/transferase [Armatimonadetes bacterium]|nr:sulfatase-like hydrolase/transferase [Armatimonadota bacterium]
MPERRKPNIILILTDDQGYGDLSCYGCKDIPTPNIDSIAQNGVRFTDGYVTCPVCSPSRAGLLTGRYQQRFGHEYNPWERTTETSLTIDENAGLPLDQITIADALKENGYATGAVGKWHLGMSTGHHPLNRGFDEFFGFLGGAHNYTDLTPDESNLFWYPIYRNQEVVYDDKEYLTDAFTREAVSFIDRYQDQPFFLYLAYNAPHIPMQSPQKYLGRFEHISDNLRRVYAAMVSAVDDGVGAVLHKLRETGLEQDTLIFFLSDNGGAAGSNNGGLRGSKGRFWEGGIRVPFLFQWPRKIPAGQVYKEPVISVDIFATAVAAAGGMLPKDRVMDGVDIVPYLTGKRKTPPHELLFWRELEMYKSFDKGYAVRKGRWKLVKHPVEYDKLYEDPETYKRLYTNRYGYMRSEDRKLLQIYDLSTDIAESKNLAEQHPEIVDELRNAYGQWESQLMWPRWEKGFWERPPVGRKAAFEIEVLKRIK